MNRRARHNAAKELRLMDAIVKGLRHAQAVGFTKEYDIALAVRVAMKNSGITVALKGGAEVTGMK